MPKADDPFLAWLSALSGPLTTHQSRLVLAALLDAFRFRTSVTDRRLWQGFFSRHWTPRPRTLLNVSGAEFEDIMQRARHPGQPGRPRRLNPLMAQHAILLHEAKRLRGRSPSLPEFRRELERWTRAGLWTPGRPFTDHALYRVHEDPERLVLRLLQLSTGKPVKDIQRILRPRRPKSPPAP